MKPLDEFFEKNIQYFALCDKNNKRYLIAFNFYDTPLFKIELNSKRIDIFNEELDFINKKYGNINLIIKDIDLDSIETKFIHI